MFDWFNWWLFADPLEEEEELKTYEAVIELEEGEEVVSIQIIEEDVE